MESSKPFFGPLFAMVDKYLLGYVDQVAGRVSAFITVPASKMLIIYVAMFGYMMLRGMVQAPIRDGIFHMLKASFIAALLDVGQYHLYVADFFLEFPDALAVVITGQSGQNAVHYLDSVWAQQYALGKAFWDTGAATSFSGLMMMLIGFFTWIAAVVSTGFSAIILLGAKMGLHIWLGIGQLWILFALFDATKQFTNAWLGQTVTFSVLPALASAVMYSAIFLCKVFLDAVQREGGMADPSILDFLMMLLLSAVALYFLWQIPSFASGLGGGVAISTMGAFGAAARMFGDSAKGAKNLMTGRTLSDMRHARRMKAANAAWAQKNPSLPVKAWRKMTAPRKNTITKT